MPLNSFLIKKILRDIEITCRLPITDCTGQHYFYDTNFPLFLFMSMYSFLNYIPRIECISSSILLIFAIFDVDPR